MLRLTLIAIVTLVMAATPRLAATAEAYSSRLKAVDERTVIAGMVDVEALHAAHPEGVLLVDLRTAAEGAPQEAEAAAALGMLYVNIPVAGATVDPAQVAELREVLAAAPPDTQVVLHCASGNRASMLWGALQVTDGTPLGEVRSRLDGILTAEPTIEGLASYARSLDSDADANR